MKRKFTVAVMQPYFAPYAGYFRLMAAADLFVIYDCVQFPRRGWVHRNRLPNAAGQAEWLTLPIAHAPFDARIDDLVFAPDAASQIAGRRRRFPSLIHPLEPAERYMHAAPTEGRVADYLVAQLRTAAGLFSLSCEFMRSSTLGLSSELKAQSRILAILQAVGASDYVNAPGGRELYDEAAFEAHGIHLRFLAPHHGSHWSVLHRLAVEDPAVLAKEIREQS